MKITAKSTDAGRVLELVGRLDNTWSDSVSAAIDEVVRAGVHHLVLDFSGVEYLSSAGIRVLLVAHRRLAAVKGFFGVVRPTSTVREVLRLSGLEKQLCREPTSAAKIDAPSAPPKPRTIVHDDRTVDVYAKNGRSAPLRFTGSTDGVLPIVCDRNLVALGVAAFDGAAAAGNPALFGEFVAFGGSAVVAPASRGSPPDYQSAAEQYLPTVHAENVASADFHPTVHLRFEAVGDARLGWSTILADVLAVVDQPAVLVVA
ncbi:MAG: STAS domain-containing protein, partial [Planctomycetia bacterium]